MKDHEVQAVLELRKLIMAQYKGLEGEGSPNTALSKTADVANFCEELMGLVDSILSPYVAFGSDT